MRNLRALRHRRLREADLEGARDYDAQGRRRRQEDREPLAELTAEPRAIGVAMHGGALALIIPGEAQDVCMPGERGELGRALGSRSRHLHMRRGEKELEDERKGAGEKQQRLARA